MELYIDKSNFWVVEINFIKYLLRYIYFDYKKFFVFIGSLFVFIL